MTRFCAVVFAVTGLGELPSIIASVPPAAHGAHAAPAAAPKRQVGDPASIVEAVRAKHNLPALIVATVSGSCLELSAAAGVRSNATREGFSLNDRVHLGSCTKAITATLAALLVHDGTLKWDSTVGAVLGPSCASMDASWRDVTLEELLRHAGGAPANAPREAWAQAWKCNDASRACRRAFIESIVSQPIAQPRGKFVYSNQGYAIVGAMLEQVTDAEYETLATDRLFKPLGMTSAGFGPPPEASGHTPDGTPSNIDNPAAISPAGRAHMTMEDWGKFVALHVRRNGGAALPLTRADFDHLHSLMAPAPAVAPAPDQGDAATPDATAAAPPPSEGMALGWMVVQRPWGGRMLTHAGSNTVWFCVAWLAPDRGFAVLAATNQGGPKATKACDEAIGAVLAWRAAQQAIEERAKAAPPTQ